MSNPKRCPRDGALLEARHYQGIELDTCGSCQGSWLDHGKLEAIQRAPGVGAGEPAVRPAQPASRSYLRAVAARGAIRCPACGGEMETREHGYASQVIIDACVSRCGVWVDQGELQALERFYESNRDNETLPLHWRLWASLLSLGRREDPPGGG